MSDFKAWLITGAVIAATFSIQPILHRIRRSRLSAADRELLGLAMRAIPASGPAAAQRSALTRCANCKTPSLTLLY